jgi:hypothetical protein
MLKCFWEKIEKSRKHISILNHCKTIQLSGSSKMKKCPMCAEEINDEARICRYCGAEFNVSKRGYCTTCHQIMEADENGACIRCGSNLVDVLIESEYIPPETTPAIPTSSSTIPSSSDRPSNQSLKKKSNLKWILISLAAFICICLMLTQTKTILPNLTGTQIPGSSGTSQPGSSQGFASTSEPSPTQVPTQKPTPLPVGAAFDHPSSEKGTACFINEGYGLTCLDEAGWHIFTEDNSILQDNSAFDIVPCPDGNLLLGNREGVFLWDGVEWRSLNINKIVTDVACGPQGEIWVTHGDGASTFDGAGWIHFDEQQVIADFSLEILSDCTLACFRDIAISPGGDLWIVSEEGKLVHFDGNTWVAIQSPYEYLAEIVPDHDGSLWAIGYVGEELYHYSDEEWIEYQNPRGGTFMDLLVDEDDRIWLSTIDGVVLIFKDGSWLAYDATAGGEIGANLNSIALDDRGRLWVGSNWGLAVFNGQDWVAYHMNTADLADYEIGTIAVAAGGPDLPAPDEREKGSVTGKIIIAGEPAKLINLEVCQFHMTSYYFYRTSPCGGKHFYFEGSTDENGAFHLEDLPPGHYSLFYQPESDDWNYGKYFLMQPGEELVLPDISIEE